MSRYDEFKELSEQLSEAKAFLSKLQAASSEDIALNISNFQVLKATKSEKDGTAYNVAKPPSLLIRELNRMMQSHCVELSEVALSRLDEHLTKIAAAAKQEAQSILQQIESLAPSEAVSAAKPSEAPTATPVAKAAIKQQVPKAPVKQQVPKAPVKQQVEQTPAPVAKAKAQAVESAAATSAKPPIVANHGKHKITIANGTQFNNWTVVRFAPEKTGNKQVFLCRCICGNEKFIDKYTLPNRFSCGCVTKKQAIKAKPSSQSKAAAVSILGASKTVDAKTPRQRLEEKKEERSLAEALEDSYE